MLAEMASAGSRARTWLASFGRRPLALRSPYPAAECLERLAAVTTPARAFQVVVYTALACLVSLGLLVAGIIQLADGHVIGLAPALAFPLPAAFFAWGFAYERRRLDARVAELLREVNEVPGSTAGW